MNESNPFTVDAGNIAAILTKRFALSDPGSGLELDCHEAHMLIARLNQQAADPVLPAERPQPATLPMDETYSLHDCEVTGVDEAAVVRPHPDLRAQILDILDTDMLDVPESYDAIEKLVRDGQAQASGRGEPRELYELAAKIVVLEEEKAGRGDRLRALVETWLNNATMLAEGNKSELPDDSVGMQRACADQLAALLDDPAERPAQP